jgi:hypothetical protein
MTSIINGCIGVGVGVGGRIAVAVGVSVGWGVTVAEGVAVQDNVQPDAKVLPLFVVEVADHFQEGPGITVRFPARLFGGNIPGQTVDPFGVACHQLYHWLEVNVAHALIVRRAGKKGQVSPLAKPGF